MALRQAVPAAAIRAMPTTGRRAAIAGLGSSVPNRVITNADLERVVSTSDSWIQERTGIQRRHVAAPGTASFELGVEAAERALAAAGVRAEEVDLLVLTSSSPDAPFPPMACRVQERIGAERAVCYDLLAACTGWLYGVWIADSQIAAGRIETALIVGAETLSRILDWSDRSTCVLLGDAAAAAVLRPAAPGAGFLSWCLGSDGRHWDLLTYGSFPEKGAYTARDPDPRFHMRGPETFRIAVDVFVQQSLAALEAADMTIADVDLFVPHQANRRIMEAAARRMGLPADRVMVNIGEFGNTSTATIPLALEEALAGRRLGPGSRVLMASFGAGLTWAATVLAWS